MSAYEVIDKAVIEKVKSTLPVEEKKEEIIPAPTE